MAKRKEGLATMETIQEKLQKEQAQLEETSSLNVNKAAEQGRDGEKIITILHSCVCFYNLFIMYHCNIP